LRAHDNAIIHKYYIEKEMSFTYTNPEYQNLFFKYMADSIKKSIIKDIQSNGFYSILVDETQDLSYHEQVSIYILYVDQHFVPHEVFLGFYKTITTDGLALTNLIKNVLNSYRIDLNNIRGQCYDGAASMRGSYSGVQSRIKDENPLALYVHCYAHILNLCLVDLAKSVSMVRNTFGTLSTLHNFIKASSKRYAIFKKGQKSNAENKTIPDSSNFDNQKVQEDLKNIKKNIKIKSLTQ